MTDPAMDAHWSPLTGWMPEWMPDTAADLDAWLIQQWPLLRDEYVAYATARACAEARADALREKRAEIEALTNPAPDGQRGEFGDGWDEGVAAVLAILETP